MQNIEIIRQMNLEVITLINQLTSKSRPVSKTGVRIKIQTANGIQELVLPVSLEDLAASDEIDVNLF